MFTIECDRIGDGWLNLLGELYARGSRVNPRTLPCRELTGVSLRVNDARNNLFAHPDRRLSYRFAIAEFLWIWFGHDDVETISKYNPNIAQFSDDGIRFFGAYGPKLEHQLGFMIDTLERDPDSRQCVMNIWRENPSKTKDVPCTLSWQLFLRDGRLNGVVTMRSSDIWLGLPYDVLSWTLFQNILAGHFKVEVGYYQINIGSSHLYERDANAAAAVLYRPTALEHARSPRLPGPPPGWLDDVLSNRGAIPNDWSVWNSYGLALGAATNRDAWQVLKDLDPPA